MSALTQTAEQRENQIVTRPLYSPERVRQLRAAMCSASMMEVLTRDWVYPKRRGLTLSDCEAVRVYPRGRDEFVIEYHISFRGDDGDRVERVFGELVGSIAEARYHQLLEALIKKRRRQIRRDDTTDLIACLPNLGLILRFPGLDEKLDGLRLAHDSKALIPILSRHLPRQRSIRKRHIRIEVLGHRLGKRCVIRYRVAGQDGKATGENTPPTSLIAKIYKTRERRAQSVFAAMESLWNKGFAVNPEYRIRIPKPLEYLNDSQMLLMEDVTGTLPNYTDSTGFEAAGRALAKLHATRLHVPRRYTIDDEISLLRNWVTVISQVYPEMKAVLENTLTRVETALDSSRSAVPTLAHRDFYEKQVLIDGGQTILIDFDTLCLADPAIDVGNFLAHQRLAALQGLGDAQQLESAFLAAYRTVAPPGVFERVEAYTDASLLRLACLYSLWPRWSHLASALLPARR